MAASTIKFSTFLSKSLFQDLKKFNWYSTASPAFYINNLPDGQGPQPYIRKKVSKPRWLPKAPSKIYKITSRRRLPPNEFAENLRLYQNHKCFMRLISNHCKNENLKLSAAGEITEKLVEEEEKEHNELMEYNRLENERLANLREHRIELEKEKLFQEILEFKTREAERENVLKEEALKRLEETQKLVLTFVDPEKLEAAIEHAIDNPIDFNFSIDLEGNIYRGKNTLPHLVDKDNLEVLPVFDDGFKKI